MNGQRNYNPWNITVNQGATEPIETRYILSANENEQGYGDSAIVPMNWNEKFYGQGKLTYRPFSEVKLNL